MRFLDTNIILDLFGPSGSATAQWSGERYGDAVEAGAVVCNVVVLAELSGSASSPAALIDRLKRFEIDLIDMTNDAAFLAGRAFREYRRRGGTRQAILADFLVGGHAAALGATLVTRDRQLASYFPDLSLITPETHP